MGSWMVYRWQIRVREWVTGDVVWWITKSKKRRPKSNKLESLFFTRFLFFQFVPLGSSFLDFFFAIEGFFFVCSVLCVSLFLLLFLFLRCASSAFLILLGVFLKRWRLNFDYESCQNYDREPKLWFRQNYHHGISTHSRNLWSRTKITILPELWSCYFIFPQMSEIFPQMSEIK